MRTLKFAASSGALVLASGILFVSLSAGNSRMLAQHGNYESSQRQFYVSQTILPDHVAYPMLMAFDKAKLITSGPEKQLLLEVEYGQRRLEYAQELLKRENATLALTTLTKAQKYLIQAGTTAHQPEVSPETKQTVLDNLQQFNQQLQLLRSGFSDEEWSVVERHAQELRVIQEQLSIQVQAIS